MRAATTANAATDARTYTDLTGDQITAHEPRTHDIAPYTALTSAKYDEMCGIPDLNDHQTPQSTRTRDRGSSAAAAPQSRLLHARRKTCNFAARS